VLNKVIVGPVQVRARNFEERPLTARTVIHLEHLGFHEADTGTISQGMDALAAKSPLLLNPETSPSRSIAWKRGSLGGSCRRPPVPSTQQRAATITLCAELALSRSRKAGLAALRQRLVQRNATRKKPSRQS
jgi:hypothetical protein